MKNTSLSPTSYIDKNGADDAGARSDVIVPNYKSLSASSVDAVAIAALIASGGDLAGLQLARRNLHMALLVLDISAQVMLLHLVNKYVNQPKAT